MSSARAGYAQRRGRRSPRRPGSLWRVFRDRTAAVSLAAMLVLLVGILVGPYFVGSATAPVITARLQPPEPGHPFGTDQLGRDVLARVVDGGRFSFAVAFGSVAVAATVGTTLGVLSGYGGALWRETVMRVMDLLLAFPAVLLALTIVAVLGHSLPNLVLALGIVYIPQFARIAHAATLGVLAEPYLEAGRALGATHRRLIGRYVLPNVMSPLLVVASAALAGAVLAEASLSFLGLGIEPPNPSWGGMLSDGKGYLEIAPWLMLFPGTVIAATIFCFNLIGDGLRDALDPRLRV
jgi:peptide/nickel transport system permease protein